MSSKFQVGDRVRSRVSAQDLVVGEVSIVRAVHEQVTPFGTFITYELSGGKRGKQTKYVRNGHLVLELAK